MLVFSGDKQLSFNSVLLSKARVSYFKGVKYAKFFGELSLVIFTMALHQFDYIFAIGTIFAFLDAWNIGELSSFSP